ncbi:MAG: hypothetical protein JNL88_04065 [Bacteroidia bacterium]|nr:hypothetical protein [Bacteroidia bacterium]
MFFTHGGYAQSAWPGPAVADATILSDSILFYERPGSQIRQPSMFNGSADPEMFAYIQANGPTTFCPGGSVLLSAFGGPAGATYIWTSGQTTKSIQVNSSGVYGVTIIANKSKSVSIAAPITVTVASLITDLDLNGVVNVLDYMLFVGVFNVSCPTCQEDFNGDGFVDIQDYLIWVADIFKSCH